MAKQNQVLYRAHLLKEQLRQIIYRKGVLAVTMLEALVQAVLATSD